MWDNRAEYVSNHDGDTVKVNLDEGRQRVTEGYDVRLLGVFAPELAEPGGIECRDFVRVWFQSRLVVGRRWGFVVITARMKVADREQKTLDRYVGTITSLDGTDNLNLDVMGFITRNGYGGGIGS